ncbi:MAG: FtsX-like permease family protein, partial [Bacteroidales bacterium]|nr:FtsX-like permease family protein [Bacteroidales bacterium]
ARKYTSEIKLGKQITAFTSVAIILSLMGVFGLVLFETQHKKKEIAIRRVLGASIVDVLLMICKKYSIIVMICFIVAAPVSWMIINRYLSNFAYHTTISWWVFGAAFIIVLAITDFIVVIRSLSTVYSNPVDSVKSE